jgi:hypothetical protein
MGGAYAPLRGGRIGREARAEVSLQRERGQPSRCSGRLIRAGGRRWRTSSVACTVAMISSVSIQA